MSRKQWLLLAALAAIVLALVLLEPGRYLNLDYLKSQQSALHAYVGANPLRASLLCFLLYSAATALSIPGAIAMTLAAGAVFGLLWGALIVSFASTCGATLAFLMARYLLRDFVQARFGHRLGTLNRGIRNDGPVYLLMVRLIPVIPFVAVNLVMALTPIRTRDFYLYSQLGMLPATLIFVNAGTQLAAIESARDIVSPEVLISLGLLALFPLIAKLIAAVIRRRRFLRRFPPPPAVDRNVIVIGAGSGGLVASLVAAAVRARVTLVEQARMGGDCLNTGCVPSKALLRVARQAHQARNSAHLGVAAVEPAIDFAAVMDHVHDAIRTIEPHDSVERYRSLGVECIEGRATIVSPWEVEVNGQRLSTRSIILATGAHPRVPALPGIDDVDYLTSDTVWDLRELPRRLLVLGGGPIGCELAQAFARLGSRVTLVERGERLLKREDPEVSALLHETFAAENIDLHLLTEARAFLRGNDGPALECARVESNHEPAITLEFDRVLIALGRVPNVSGYGLEELGISVGESGTLEVNDSLQTRLPNVYACGDVAGPYQFTHTASHQAWYAAVNALFGGLRRLRVDYSAIPWCTFTDPEVAHVGLNEAEARQQGVAFEVTRYELADLDRAITDGQRRGWVKVLTPPGSDRILGACIVGEHAGEMIGEFVMAMKHKLGLGKILGTIHVYPTYGEANKHAAGAWRRRHSPARVLRWLERFHTWRREGRRRAA